MGREWRRVKLGEALRFSRETAEIDPLMTYKQVTVKLHHKGVVLREEKMGQQIKSKQYLAKTGQFIISRIDARNGAMGLVPTELDGAIVTNDFLLYDIDETKLFSRYFDYLTSTEGFVQKCISASEGTTNRVRLKPEKFLEIEIPLPPLDEQKRIVERVESLMARVEEARRVRAEAVGDVVALFESTVDKIFYFTKSFGKKALSNLTSKIGSGCTPKGGHANYPDSGVPFIRSLNIRTRKFQWDDIAYIYRSTHDSMKGTQVKSNDVLLNITGASIGRVACAPSDLVEANVNQHVAIIRPIDKINPQYLMYWISQPAVQKTINDQQKGATRQALTKKQIENFEIPLPPLQIQHRIVTYLDSLQSKVDELKKLQAEIEKEMEELISSILDRAFGGEL